MTIHDQIRTALSNVGRRKLRSALASLGVVVGTLTIVIMVSLAAGVRQQINHQFASLGLDRLTVIPPAAGAAVSVRVRFCRRSPARKSSRRRMSTAGKNCPASPKIIPEVNLPGSVGLELKGNGTNQSVRLSGGEPMRGNFVSGIAAARGRFAGPCRNRAESF